ncbi:MAG: hydrogenase maturation nickel metallochaperone HypA [Clostridiales Family XIII bacterium]|jgi:hydrogenase nickel incorporation protein HypA/HybF|nr:hydrogenase maturation nickel metallochaperone HypA [Clostridiales Family XIII bacterium]
MHELSIMEDVLEISVNHAKANGAERIRKITICAGALSNIIPKWATLFFRMVGKDTIAEGAVLDFITLPAEVVCRDCGKRSEIEVNPPVFRCAHCGSGNVGLVSGREFRVVSIEIGIDR